MMNFTIKVLKNINIFKGLHGYKSGIQLQSVRCLFEDKYKGKVEADHDLSSDLPLENATNPFEREKIKCILCENNIHVDYKNVRLLSQFVSRYTGKVYGRHITRLCKAQQMNVEKAIEKAQTAGLMGYYTRDINFAKDPQLFNPDQPVRPHRF